LTTEDVVLRPLRSTDAEADLEALMSSREMLRTWDQSDWPSDDFTLEENQEDLEEHESDHAARRAFTYTVLDPSEQRCLGCVYLYPLKLALGRMGADDETLADVGERDAYVTFWVRESELAGGLEGRLLAALLSWFDEEWSFSRIALGGNTADGRQLSLFEDFGFTGRWQFPIPRRDAQYVVCVR
jgi:hypothetical protein